MKKILPYILGGVIVTALILMFATGAKNKTRNRVMDERITLKKADKIPYGTYIAYRNLKYLFPEASISANRYEPGYWDSLSRYDGDQALIIVTDRFIADKTEMKELISFAENGNDVFVSARYISAAADQLFGCNSSTLDLSYMGGQAMKGLTLTLKNPPFEKESSYKYPGKAFRSYFTSVDTATTTILGHDEDGHPDFIHLRAGKGNFYVHLEPLAFSNYFLLHKENIGYYEKALSVIRPDMKKVVWDEYYLNKNDFDEPNPKKKGWFSALMNMKNDAGKHSFRAAFWLLIGLLVLYVLLEMRRKQRVIPVMKKPKNDSLDFVKTIGRLYYDKGDHHNLCRKMGMYFLEHVRANYKLPTGTLDEDFIKNLQYKSGAPEPQIRGIVSFIKYLDTAPAVSPAQLNDFYHQLESFYQKV